MQYADFIEKVAELMDRAKVDALEQAKIVWSSGAIDTEFYGNSYSLPKIFVTAYAKRMKDQFTPTICIKEAQKEIKNLEKFI